MELDKHDKPNEQPVVKELGLPELRNEVEAAKKVTKG